MKTFKIGSRVTYSDPRSTANPHTIYRILRVIGEDDTGETEEGFKNAFLLREDSQYREGDFILEDEVTGTRMTARKMYVSSAPTGFTPMGGVR